MCFDCGIVKPPYICVTKANKMAKLITNNDIVENAKFKTENGIIWIIDQVKNGLVYTSMEGGKKNNYRDDIDTVVEFLNEENAIKF